MIDTNQASLKNLKTIYQTLLLSKNIELLKNLQELFYYIYILAIYHEKDKSKSKTITNLKSKTDAKDRLKSNSLLNHYFKYDKQDNIIETNHNTKNEIREANVDNEYVKIKSNNQDITIEYDKDGNLKRYNNQEFRYDYLNRLIEVKEDNKIVATFTYDALNRRVTKTTEDNQTTRYIYDDDKVIQEITGNTQNDITYIYNSYKDDPVAFIKNNQTYYYIKDRQYSIKYITDQNGEIKESYSYTSYGITTIKDQNNINKTIPMQGYGYTGRRYDAKIKLYHYRNRAYSPTLARFIQTDPKGYVDGYNLYAYVKNNPLRYLDPMGTTKRYGNSLSFSNITDADIKIDINYDKLSSNEYYDYLEGTSVQYPKYEYSSTSLIYRKNLKKLSVFDKLVNNISKTNKKRQYGSIGLVQVGDGTISMVEAKKETSKKNILGVGINGSIGKAKAKMFSIDGKLKSFTVVNIGFNTYTGELNGRIGNFKLGLVGYVGGVSGKLIVGKNGGIGLSFGVGLGLKWSWVDYGE